MLQGLVDAGVIDNDDPTRVVRTPSVVICDANQMPHLVLRIAAVRPEPNRDAA